MKDVRISHQLFDISRYSLIFFGASGQLERWFVPYFCKWTRQNGAPWHIFIVFSIFLLISNCCRRIFEVRKPSLLSAEKRMQGDKKSTTVLTTFPRHGKSVQARHLDIDCWSSSKFHADCMSAQNSDMCILLLINERTPDRWFLKVFLYEEDRFRDQGCLSLMMIQMSSMVNAWQQRL